ncbi:hypothetical protein L209DRAFT_520946 [Thermothelomyces heterothallicus CBS 203.75]
MRTTHQFSLGAAGTSRILETLAQTASITQDCPAPPRNPGVKFSSHNLPPLRKVAAFVEITCGVHRLLSPSPLGRKAPHWSAKFALSAIALSCAVPAQTGWKALLGAATWGLPAADDAVNCPALGATGASVCAARPVPITNAARSFFSLPPAFDLPVRAPKCLVEEMPCPTTYAGRACQSVAPRSST